MKLIELYLDEIRQQLPPHNREDILKEIRSTLMDTLDDRMGDSPPAEDDIIAVLRDFGSPRQVAQQYGAQRYLIGPRLYPTYLVVLRIVLIVIAALNVFGVVITIIKGSGFDSGAFTAVFQVVGNLIASLFTAFGTVTLSFAIVERTIPEEWKIEVGQTWQPEDLVKKEDGERVNIAELAVEITASLAFIVLINFFLDVVAIYYLDANGWTSTPLLNAAFPRYIPWITGYVVLNILLDLYLIRKGYWDKFASVSKLVINVFQIAVAFAIILGPDVITVQATTWHQLNLNLSFTIERLNQILNRILDVLLGLSIIGNVVDTGKRGYNQYIKGTRAKIEVDI